MRWSSYRARWQGSEYDMAPDHDGDRLWVRLRTTAPTPGFEPVTPGCYVRVVPAEACEEISFVTTICRWRAEPCHVREARGDDLLLEYIGGRVPVARARGFDRIERGVYRAWVPRAEVEAFGEHRVRLDG